MKKLLILLLILGMATTASAPNINFSLDGSNPMGTAMDVQFDQVINLSIIDDTDGLGYFGVKVQMNRDSFTAPATFTDWQSVQDGSWHDYSTESFYNFGLDVSAEGKEDGEQFRFKLTITGDDELDFYDTFSFWILAFGDNMEYTKVHEVTCTVVPEPMTILLLGVGGLALLRKR